MAAAQNFEGKIIHKIHISTTRMNPAVVARKFPLKEGHRFSTAAYERAQNKLHDMRQFKNIAFSLEEAQSDQVDIFISCDDGYYVFPLAFFSGGDNNAFMLSVAEGNYFKQGETAFVNLGTSNNGFTTSGGLAQGDNFFNVKYTKLDVTERFYNDYWSSSYGVLSVSDDEGEYGIPNRIRDMRSYSFSVLFARAFGDLRVFLSPDFKHISYSDQEDAGNHNQLTAGIQYQSNLRNSSGMGALFGFGLSDKQKMLQKLPQREYGYSFLAAYTNGNDWTGSDYKISRLQLGALWQVKLKTHHVFDLEFKAEDAFNSPFSDQVLSTDLLSGQGRYRRLIRGTRGAGVSTSFMYYLLRNNTGLLALRPFYELAYIRAGNAFRHHSGAGATLSYKFWRFPFPIGLNYTRNLSDNSDMTAVVVGGRF